MPCLLARLRACQEMTDESLLANGHVLDAVPGASEPTALAEEWAPKPAKACTNSLMASMSRGDRQRLMRMLQLKSSFNRQRGGDAAPVGGDFGAATAARVALHHPRVSTRASVNGPAAAAAAAAQQRPASAPQRPLSADAVPPSACEGASASAAGGSRLAGTDAHIMPAAPAEREQGAASAADAEAADDAGADASAAAADMAAEGSAGPPEEPAVALHHVQVSPNSAAAVGGACAASPSAAGGAALARRAQQRLAQGSTSAYSPFRATAAPTTNLALNRSPSHGELEAQLVRERHRAARRNDLHSLNRLKTASGVAAFYRAQRVRAYSLAQRQHNGVAPTAMGGGSGGGGGAGASGSGGGSMDDLNVQRSEFATQTGDDADLAASMLARDEQSLEHLAEADLAYLEMVRTKAGLHHNTAGALATSEAEQALADSWQKLIMLRLKSQKLQLRSRTQPMSQTDKERIESDLMLETARIASRLQQQLQQLTSANTQPHDPSSQAAHDISHDAPPKLALAPAGAPSDGSAGALASGWSPWSDGQRSPRGACGSSAANGGARGGRTGASGCSGSSRSSRAPRSS